MKCINCGENRDVVCAKITDKNGEQHYCLNCCLSLYLRGKLNIENNPDFIDDITGESGAVRYQNGDECYTLERKTLGRLISHNLDPDEYFALVAKYGADKFELHDDFYDEFDGVAIQPATLDDPWDE